VVALRARVVEAELAFLVQRADSGRGEGPRRPGRERRVIAPRRRSERVDRGEELGRAGGLTRAVPLGPAQKEKVARARQGDEEQALLFGLVIAGPDRQMRQAGRRRTADRLPVGGHIAGRQRRQMDRLELKPLAAVNREHPHAVHVGGF
jgi:hypothetical protein